MAHKGKNKRLNSYERVHSTLKGEDADYAPFFFHLPWSLQHLAGDMQAALTLDFSSKVRSDIICMPSPLYFPFNKKQAFHEIKGLASLQKANLAEAPWSERLRAVDKIVQGCKQQYSVFESILSPLSAFVDLIGAERVMKYQKSHPGIFDRAMRAVADSLRDYIKSLEKTNCCGYFVHIRGLSSDIFSRDWIRRYQIPMLKELLELKDSFPHFIGLLFEEEGQHWEDICQLPFDVLSYPTAGNTFLQKRLSETFPGKLMGGISTEVLSHGSAIQLHDHIDASKESRVFDILAPDYPLDHRLDLSRLILASQAVFGTPTL